MLGGYTDTFNRMGADHIRRSELKEVCRINRFLKRSTNVSRLLEASKDIRAFKDKYPNSKYIRPLLDDLEIKIKQLK